MYVHILLKDPIQITLESQHVWVGEGLSRQVKEIKEKFVYIPLLQVLEQLLMCPGVYEEVHI